MTNEALQKLKAPAVGLIITGAFNIFSGFFLLISGVARLFRATGDKIPDAPADKLGYFVSTGFLYGVCFFSFLLAPVIIYGGAKMLGGKNIGLARAAAVLALLPLSSCCWVIGVPFGVWTLILLRRPEVKDVFENRTGDRFSPPPAPPNW